MDYSYSHRFIRVDGPLDLCQDAPGDFQQRCVHCSQRAALQQAEDFQPDLFRDPAVEILSIIHPRGNRSWTKKDPTVILTW